MELIYLHIKDSEDTIPFEITYGIHRELQEFLLQDDRLYKLFNDLAISDTVIKICLSTRNAKGQVVTSFTDIDTLEVEDIMLLLNGIFEYISDFFLVHQEMIQNLAIRLNQISSQSQPSLKNPLES